MKQALLVTSVFENLIIHKIRGHKNDKYMVLIVKGVNWKIIDKRKVDGHVIDYRFTHISKDKIRSNRVGSYAISCPLTRQISC